MKSILLCACLAMWCCTAEELALEPTSDCAGHLGISQTWIQSDEANYDGEVIHLSGHVHVVSEMGEIYADRAVVDTLRVEGEWQASHVTLTGHVKMNNGEKTQFALADHIEVFPQEKVMVLEAETGMRVLFIDTAKHMQLAAHKIRAERGEKDTVQGYGDVRFVFGTEELDRLKTQFSLE